MATSTPTKRPGRPKTSSSEARSVTRTRINGWFLLIVSAAFLVSGIALYLLRNVQVARNSVTLKDRAEAAEKEGEYAQAAALYAQYLEFQPDDFDALLHSVRLRDGMATSGQALSLVQLGYEEVLRRDPERDDEADIRQDAAAVAIVIQRYATALDHLTALKDDSTFEEFHQESPASHAKLANLHFQIGQCHEGEGRILEAFRAYRQAVENNDDEPKYYLAIAQLVVKSQLDLPKDEFADLGENEIQALPPAKRIAAIASRIDQKEFPAEKAADEILTLMVEKAKDTADAHVARARFYYSRVRLDEARQDIDKAVNYDPKNVETRLLGGQLALDQARLARLRYRFTNYSKYLVSARRAVEAGQELAPDDARFHRLQALIEDESREGALLLPAVAERTRQTGNNVAGFKSLLAKIHWKHFDAAEKALQKGIDVAEKTIETVKKQKPVRIRLRINDPNPKPNLLQLTELNNQLNWALADTLISKHVLLAEEPPNRLSESENRLKKAREQIEVLEKARASRGLIDFLTARMLMVEKNWSEAARQFEQTRLRLTGQSELKNRLYLLLGECYSRMGNPDQQLQVARRALEENSNRVEWLLRLPQLYRQANRPADALKAYEDIGSLPGASLEIAKIRLQNERLKPPADRDFRAVSDILEKATLQTPEQFRVLALLRAELLINEANLLDNKGQAVDALEKYQAAVSELEEALTKWPEEAQLWAARARLELYPKNRTSAAKAAAAKQILNQATEEIGDQLPLRLVRVQIATLSPVDAARKELEALEKPAFSDAEQSQFLMALARANLGLETRDLSDKGKHKQRALAYFEEAARLQPNDVDPQIDLAELARELNQSKPIDVAIKRVTALEGTNGPNGNYLKALKIVTEAGSVAELNAGDQQRVRELLRQAGRDRSSWAVLSRIEGDLEWIFGNKAEAVRLYEQAYWDGDRSWASLPMYDRMIEFYVNNLRRDEAREFLKRVELSTPVQFTNNVGIDWEAKLSATYLGQIFLGQWRAERGESSRRVLEPLEKARELAPEKPEPWLALVSYHVSVNDHEQARKIIDTAKSEIAKTPPYLAPLTVARCYDSLGDREAAEQKYKEAVNLAKPNEKDAATTQIALVNFYQRSPADDPQKQKENWQTAIDLLDKLPRSSLADEVQAAAVRAKAQLLSLLGRSGDALRLLPAPGKDVSVSDLLARVQVLLARNRYEDRLELIKTLEELENRKRVDASRKFLLARLYQQTDNWPAAEKRFLEILNLDEKNSTVLAAYISGLISQEELDGAQRRLDQLKTQQTNSFALAILEATLLQAKGEQPKAVALILDGAANLEEVDSPAEAVTNLVLEGSLNGAVEELEKLARDTGNGNLLAVLQDVKILIQQNKSNEAADRLKRLLQAARLPFAVQIVQLKAAVRLLDGWGELKAAETIARKIVERSDQPEDVLMLISNLARQDRIDEALTLCQKAWADCDPGRVGAMCVGILRTGYASAVQTAQAEKQLAAGMKRHPDVPELKIALADLRDFQERYDDAEDEYRDILKDKGSSSAHLTALNNLAWLMAMRGKNVADAEKLIDLAVAEAEKRIGPVPQLLDTRAAICLKLKKHSEALRDLKRALNVSKKPDPLIYFHLAQAQLAVSDKPAAIKSFEKSKSLKASDFHPLERETYQEISGALASP